MRVQSSVLAVSLALILGSSARAATLTAADSAGLNDALTNAQPGDTIVLTPGATYTGNFTLPNKGGAAFITIETSPAGLPGDGARIDPAQADGLAKLRSPNNQPALQTSPGAHHWRIALVEFEANDRGEGDIITLGDGSGAQASTALVPHDLILDRCYIHGDASVGQKRAIALNSAATTVTGSYIADIKAVGQDSQAIAGWNGPGPFSITNNYLEAAGENILFGGADPAIPNLVPSDITISGNEVTKQTAWRTQSWQVKNLLELKNARRVTVQSNVFENNWQAAQSGFGILFTVRNQDGGCPWCQVAQVTFAHNIVRHIAAGVSVLGYDNNHPSQQTEALTIQNNLFYDIDNVRWGGNGYFLQLVGGPRDILVDHNTIIQPDAYGIVTMDGPPIQQFTFTNNLARQNAYGIIGSDHAPGDDSIGAFLPASLISSNAIADASASRYPAGNSFPTSAEFESQFVSYAAGDFRLVANSLWLLAGSDGADLGANLSSSANPVVQPSPAVRPGAPSQRPLRPGPDGGDSAAPRPRGGSGVVF